MTWINFVDIWKCVRCWSIYSNVGAACLMYASWMMHIKYQFGKFWCHIWQDTWPRYRKILNLVTRRHISWKVLQKWRNILQYSTNHGWPGNWRLGRVSAKNGKKSELQIDFYSFITHVIYISGEVILTIYRNRVLPQEFWRLGQWLRAVWTVLFLISRNSCPS